MMFNKKIPAFFIMTFFLTCILPLHAGAKLTLDTQTISGIIVGIQDKVIELEGGARYYPLNKDQVLDVHPGDLVTLVFYIDPEEKNYYVAVAPGKNSLSGIAQPEQNQGKKVY